MSRDWWSDDNQLLDALGEAIRSAADMPAELTDMGKAAYAWRGIDAELATLTYDSVSEEDHASLAASRAESASLRYLTFTSGDMTLELEVTADSLLGQLVPPQPGHVQASTADGEFARAVIDEVGAFTIRPVPRGSFRLHCQTAAGVHVTTHWFTLRDSRDE